MADITAGMVKELREMTGAGMMDCKKALAATEGDMDKAVEFLREKGLAAATKKAGRIAAEGVVKTLLSDDHNAVVVEVNSETDTVSMLHDVTLGGTGKEQGDRHPKVGKGVMHVY